MNGGYDGRVVHARDPTLADEVSQRMKDRYLCALWARESVYLVLENSGDVVQISGSVRTGHIRPVVTEWDIVVARQVRSPKYVDLGVYGGCHVERMWHAICGGMMSVQRCELDGIINQTGDELEVNGIIQNTTDVQAQLTIY